MYYQELLDRFVSMSKEILGTSLTGIYLHGSIAMGCFNAYKSDIDIIVVIECNITDDQKLRFMQNVLELNEEAPAKGLEISIVKREYCKPFVYPTPFELHFSPMHLHLFREEPDSYIKHMNGTDKDLAAHFTVINKCGVVLLGETIPSVFGYISEKDYIDSIWSDVENARQDIAGEPMYIILNLCRVLAFLREGICLSKAQGGQWGIKNLSEKYHSLIWESLKCYRSDQAMQINQNLSEQFANDMLTEIRQRKDEIIKI